MRSGKKPAHRQTNCPIGDSVKIRKLKNLGEQSIIPKRRRLISGPIVIQRDRVIRLC
jgi:hypothetical protein